jgi:hypothetical protein
VGVKFSSLQNRRKKTGVKYFDIMFLYPYICMYFKFPVGHPKIYFGNDCANITEMIQKEGVIKCRVLARNRELYHPVLPIDVEAS